MLKLLELYTPEKGPTVFINATTHGNEVYGKEICEHLYKNADLKRGKLIMLPIANPYAYERGTRNYKNKDLNRTFPGKREGDLIDKLAYEIFEVAKQADYVIDIHSHASRRKDYVNTPVKNEELAKVFDLPIKHIQKPEYQHTLTNQISKLGKIAFTLEIGKVEKEKVLSGVEKLKKFLKELDMV